MHRFLLILGLVVILGGCAKPTEQSPLDREHPFLMTDGRSLLINTYSMAQNDYSISQGIPLVSDRPRWYSFPEDEALAIMNEVFFEAGFEVERDVQFQYGKIRCLLDGWESRRGVGFLWQEDSDIEGSLLRNLSGRMKAVGLAMTARHPYKLSLSEIMWIETLAMQDRSWIAIVPAVQFGFTKAQDPFRLMQLLHLSSEELPKAFEHYREDMISIDAAWLDKRREQLYARTRMFVQWVKARQKLLKKQAGKKKPAKRKKKAKENAS